jgi:hypothetical protein
MSTDNKPEPSAWDEASVDEHGEIHFQGDEMPPSAAQAARASKKRRSMVPNGMPSMTLMQIGQGRRPNPETVCEICPASVWMAGREVKCYCRIMHLISWISTDPQPLTHCDGVALATEQSEGE